MLNCRENRASGVKIERVSHVSTMRLANGVPVSVERVEKDKDADENVGADHISTERLVRSGQSIDFFAVSGLSHAVVKQAENFRVREFVKKIESHLRREGFQADLQQNKRVQPVE